MLPNQRALHSPFTSLLEKCTVWGNLTGLRPVQAYSIMSTVELNKLNIHVENLLPGVVLLALFTAVISKGMIGRYPQQFEWLMGQSIPGGLVFTAAAYTIGVLAVTLSNLLLDAPSAHTIRPLILRFRYPALFGGRSNAEVDEKYWDAIWMAERNAIEERRQEIQKRRERGRLVRSSLLPVMVAVCAIVGSGGWGVKALLCLACYGTILFLYAYSEVELFRVCRRDSRLTDAPDVAAAKGC
jgi:hypothetical protein